MEEDLRLKETQRRAKREKWPKEKSVFEGKRGKRRPKRDRRIQSTKVRITIRPGLRSQGRRGLGRWQMSKDMCFRAVPFSLSIPRLQPETHS